MSHTALTPVFVGLRTSLHILFVALTVLVVVRALVESNPYTVAVVVLAVVLLATYGFGGYLARHAMSSGASAQSATAYVWALVLSAEWLVLVWLSPDAAYLVFPLFFLYLHLLPRGWRTLAVLGSTLLAIAALGLHSEWTVGGVVGPLVGAGVAIVIGLGYKSLAAEAAERELLVKQLLETRDQLAQTERESGVLAERARLAREIHDTVAQGLSSIQMLLHAAERADPDAAGLEHVRLARETAAANLADTRNFIRELAPAALVDQGIGAALRRLADTQWQSPEREVRVRVADALDLPMPVQTALLRIAQGAMANVVQHSEATQATISIERDRSHVRLTIADNGRGFDPAVVEDASARGFSDSFGLTATRERVEQLDGALTVESQAGEGTTVMVDLTVAPRAVAGSAADATESEERA
ncbi:signal transduction histidine kinase [Salinibacterium amurskyense]|uniref:Signal transduction histidine kinase n=1 Tax=Salinibacterium amurskyense TaxID=205941 RepID=A0A2M9D5F9_9MICO|nr:sensor histidine kinase [Salinibacterium amurskyense]PJJ80951.1 signal transduction histidine kinase [Salinibacterium amurskyense]RLQ82992.1 sensor histidine kinase [Salinibacterium amurskyense]GHD81977.1 two-component sensor histidine kinase [Salinibacterium amurskyense]